MQSSGTASAVTATATFEIGNLGIQEIHTYVQMNNVQYIHLILRWPKMVVDW